MKRKFAIIFFICIALFLGACGADPATVDYNGHSYGELKTYSEGLITQLASFDKKQLEEQLKNGKLDANTRSLMEQWIPATGESGDFKEIGAFSVTKSGKTLTTDHYLSFQNRDVTLKVVYNYGNMTVTGFTVEPVYTLGEKLSKAGINTLISMSVVFAVLILISLVISCFKFLQVFQPRKEGKPQAAPVTVPELPDEDVEEVDDTELVAVIAAAIAACTGSSTSDFVVRSIHRR